MLNKNNTFHKCSDTFDDKIAQGSTGPCLHRHPPSAYRLQKTSTENANAYIQPWHCVLKCFNTRKIYKLSIMWRRYIFAFQRAFPNCGKLFEFGGKSGRWWRQLRESFWRSRDVTEDYTCSLNAAQFWPILMDLTRFFRQKGGKFNLIIK